MNIHPINRSRQDRRRFLTQLSLGAFWLTVPGAFADELIRTPRQGEGPFYPDKLPLDTDNDLLIINNGITPAIGDVTWLSGRVLDARGEPMRNAVVEIWQCDHTGVYIHTKDSGAKPHDNNFQGFGRFVTGSTGEYVFRTIKPVPYSGRTAHIHFKVKRSGEELLTTECYIKGHPKNESDEIYRSIHDGKALAAVSVDFTPLKNSRIGELAAHFDIVLGFTPEA